MPLKQCEYFYQAEYKIVSRMWHHSIKKIKTWFYILYVT